MRMVRVTGPGRDRCRLRWRHHFYGDAPVCAQPGPVEAAPVMGSLRGDRDRDGAVSDVDRLERGVGGGADRGHRARELVSDLGSNPGRRLWRRGYGPCCDGPSQAECGKRDPRRRGGVKPTRDSLAGY
jgi:hypothetical protein